MTCSNLSPLPDFLSCDNVKKQVLPYYNLEDCNIYQVKFKNTEKQRAIYKVEGKDKSFCLKKVYFSEDELLFMYSAMEWIYRNNINVPRLLPTNFNGRFVNYNDMIFILTPWIEGVKCDYDNPSHLLKSSYNLGKMHKVTENFVPIKGSFLRQGRTDFSKSIEKHFNELIDCLNLALKYNDKFSKVFIKNFENNIKLAEISLKTSYCVNTKNLPKSLCHMDYVNKNIIFDNNEDIWVIDFDKCKIDYYSHDISYFLRRLLKRDCTNWSLNTTIKCLNCYEKSRKLNKDEYNYILSYLAFPQKFWKISRDYYNNIDKCNKKSFITLIKKSVKHSYDQLLFAEEFKKYINLKFKN